MKNPNAKQPSKKPSLMYLLAWGKKQKVYTEIYPTGSARCVYYSGKKALRNEFFGDSPYQALVKAHRKENK